MPFLSTPELRAEIVTACKVLTYFKIVEGFGHVSARVPGRDGDPDRVIITPRRALGLVTEGDLVELDMEGKQVAGEIGRPPLEAIMHIAVYRRRPEVMGIARGHPRHVAAFACAGAPIKVAHGFGANLGPVVRCTKEPFLVSSTALAVQVADALGTDAEAVMLHSNGMLSVGQSVPHACVQALFMEETAELQLAAEAARLGPRHYTPEGAARRHGDDRVHEPIRAWEYYVGVMEGRIRVG
jgi:ribulose-5-phosphate 4-epimerase/fuculose-1-phosphate aldolase